MNFRPELAAAVLAGEKTLTRRLASPNPRSPWWEGGCRLAVGRTYAVCPGRGRPAVGRVRILGTRLGCLGRLDDAEARAEGFACAAAFETAWAEINGGYDPAAPVWRVEFEAVGDTPREAGRG